MTSIIRCAYCGATNDSSKGISCYQCGTPFYFQRDKAVKPIKDLLSTTSEGLKPSEAPSFEANETPKSGSDNQQIVSRKPFWCAIGLIICLILFYFFNKDSNKVQPHQGDLSKRGGTATVRESFTRQEDDPTTTNDESNDQPVGYFGTITLRVHNPRNGNTYTLDADVNETSVDRIYFPKGGWIDFYRCELDEDLQGECEDEQGRSWVFEGEK